MSTIRVDNFGPSAGGTTYSARGIAKAWCNLNGTGTIAARDSQNVSSFTDIGTGQYQMTFTSAFAAQDYAFTGSGGEDRSGNSSHRTCNAGMPNSGASYCLMLTSYVVAGSNRTDYDELWVLGVVTGDLA